MKFRIFFISFVNIFFITGFAFAQAQTNTPDFFVQEFQSKVIAPTLEQKTQRTTSETLYQDERELLMRQINVITGDEETRYIIVPGDTLTVSYYDRDALEQSVYKVSSEGEIYMPLIGPVKVQGLNRKQARAKISDMLKEYIRHPKVKVGVNESGRFMVVGAVNKPGVYYLRSNLTVMEAILIAGSYIKSDANLKSVMLMRGSMDKPIVTRLNLKKFVRKGQGSDNLLVKPGDMIYVPTSFIAHLDKFQATVYRHLLTYYGWGGTVPLKNP